MYIPESNTISSILGVLLYHYVVDPGGVYWEESVDAWSLALLGCVHFSTWEILGDTRAKSSGQIYSQMHLVTLQSV